MRTILWYRQRNRSDRRWCFSVLTASTDTKAFIASSWQDSPPPPHPPILLFSITAGSESLYLLTVHRGEFRQLQVHACHSAGFWVCSASNVTCALASDLDSEPYRNRDVRQWVKGGNERQAIKAVIIHWKSLLNMQYPFTIHSVRRLKPNCERTKAKSH